MFAFPEMCDVLTDAFRRAVSVGNVFDGPPTQQAGQAGVSVGATREDIASEFSAPAGALDGVSGEDVTITCLAWSGSGSTTFKVHRDTVRGFLDAIEGQLSLDRSLGGAVDTVWIDGGTWTQDQTGQGALVTCEFRVTLRRF